MIQAAQGNGEFRSARPDGRMTRLLFVVRGFGCGGAERQLVELLNGIDKARFDVSVISLYPGGALWQEAISVPGIGVHHLGKKGRWDLGAIPALWNQMRRLKPDIVHGYMHTANVLAVLGKPLGAKIVWGVRASRLEASHYDYLHRVERSTESLLAPMADLIICNSHAAREQLVTRGYPVGRTIVVSNGIDIQRFRPDPAYRDVLRAEWGVRPEEFLVGLIARLDPMKGHSVFIAAARRVVMRQSDVKFVIVGDGPEAQRQALRSLVQQLDLQNKLIWAGQRADVPAVISALDLSVSASIFGEGFSNALGESMACGVPCVATDVGDSARIVGDLGWVVSPGDESGLADRILQAVQFCRTPDSRPELIRARIAREFSVQKMVDATMTALSSLVCQRVIA